MSIDKVVNFPFPTPPPAESLVAAEKLLLSLGALEKPNTSQTIAKGKKAKGKDDANLPPLLS